MSSRLDLHEKLVELLGSQNVYFQPPESIKLNYPCIVYSISDISKRNADNRLYSSAIEYEVIVIDPDPDSEIPMKILTQFSMCRFDRAYTSDNLNHSVLSLYY